MKKILTTLMGKEEVQLGQKVKCEVTGFSGIVDHIVYPLHDAKKIGIQGPMTKDGKMGECYVVDAHGVKVLEKKPVVEAIQSKPKYKLASKVECEITGFRGTITAYAIYLNGCVRYKVQPKIPSGKKAEDYASQYLPEGSIKVIEAPKENKEPQKTGGPKERVIRERF